MAPYTWSVSGALPVGLDLDENVGRLGGMPTVPGDASFTISVEDSRDVQATRRSEVSVPVGDARAAGLRLVPCAAVGLPALDVEQAVERTDVGQVTDGASAGRDRSRSPPPGAAGPAGAGDPGPGRRRRGPFRAIHHRRVRGLGPRGEPHPGVTHVMLPCVAMPGPVALPAGRGAGATLPGGPLTGAPPDVGGVRQQEPVPLRGERAVPPSRP
jgi:hypothetical protein